MTDYTSNLNLELIDFNLATWHDKAWNNYKLIDAACNILGLSLKGLWTNSTAVVVGEFWVDGTDGTIWEVLVAHTTAASPTTFSADRTTNPTYWAQVNIAGQWRGAWAATTYYSKNDIAYESNIFYQCHTAHTSGASFVATNWTIVVDLSTSVSAAAASASAAAASAAAVELPDPAVASTFLRRNSGNTEYETRTPQEVADQLAALTTAPVVSAINEGPTDHFAEKLINNDWRFWQRGTSQTAAGFGSADRWSIQLPSGTVSASRQGFGLSEVSNTLPQYFMRMQFTSAGVFSGIMQPIKNVRTLEGKKVTVSIIARYVTNAPTSPRIVLQQYFGSGGSPSSSVNKTANITGLSTSFALIQEVITLDSISSKTLGSDGKDALRLYIDNATAETWDMDILFASVRQGDITNETYVYTPRPEPLEQLLCEAFYEKSEGNEGSGFFFSGDVTNTATYYTTCKFRTRKLLTPTIATSGENLSGFPSVSVAQIDKGGFRVSGTCNSTGSAGYFIGQWTANGELDA